jgi:hypothetical protein
VLHEERIRDRDERRLLLREQQHGREQKNDEGTEHAHGDGPPSSISIFSGEREG